MPKTTNQKPENHASHADDLRSSTTSCQHGYFWTPISCPREVNETKFPQNLIQGRGQFCRSPNLHDSRARRGVCSAGAQTCTILKPGGGGRSSGAQTCTILKIPQSTLAHPYSKKGACSAAVQTCTILKISHST